MKPIVRKTTPTIAKVIGTARMDPVSHRKPWKRARKTGITISDPRIPPHVYIRTADEPALSR